ncbi:MAG: hypothetical protein R2827_12020 [Bdellovibrionales bacterium]
MARLYTSAILLKGANCTVHPVVEKIIREFHDQSKPIAAFCIAPALIARVLGSNEVELTVGNDPEVSAQINKTGAQHIECAVDDYVTDRMNKVITSPAYMYEAQPFEVFTGIKQAISEFVEMA